MLLGLLVAMHMRLKKVKEKDNAWLFLKKDEELTIGSSRMYFGITRSASKVDIRQFN
jgi:hypothetical protein